MNNKNLDEAKDCLENFRKGINLVFGNQQQFPYQIKRVLKEFNNECDKIRFSKNTVYNYRKCIVDTMEEFLNQTINILKNEEQKIRSNKRRNRNY